MTSLRICIVFILGVVAVVEALSVRYGTNHGNLAFTVPLSRIHLNSYGGIPKQASSASLALNASHNLNGESINAPLQPLRNFLLIERRDTETTSSGGVLLPTDSREEQVVGRIVAAGGGDINQATGKKIPMAITEGDWVIFSKHAGETIKYDGKDCVLVSSDDVLAKAAVPDLSPQIIQPVADVIFVRIVKSREKSEGGLLLPSNDQYKPQTHAQVVGKGPGRYDDLMNRHPPEVSVGDSVLFSAYAQDTSQLRFNGIDYAFVRASDILAKW